LTCDISTLAYRLNYVTMLVGVEFNTYSFSKSFYSNDGVAG